MKGENLSVLTSDSEKLKKKIVSNILIDKIPPLYVCSSFSETSELAICEFLQTGSNIHLRS